MKIVAISDTHGLHRGLKLPQGDMIIHAGDMCHFGDEQQLYDFLKWYNQLDFKYKILVAGNHDFLAADEPEKFEAALPKSILYLNDSGVEIESYQIWGSPVQPDLVGMAFGRPRGKAMNKHWKLIPDDVDVLITHTPPKGILDDSTRTNLLGCEYLRKKLDDVQPKLHIFGHVHASYGITEIEQTTYINASSIGDKQSLINPPIVSLLDGKKIQIAP